MFRRPELDGVKGRHQRRTVTARGHVATAEIGNRGDPGTLGDQRRVAQLHREGVLTLGAVTDRLAMAADGADPGGGLSALPQQLSNRLGKNLGQRRIQFTQTIDIDGVGMTEFMHRRLQVRREGVRVAGE